jgi:hypothetical protein
METVIVLLLNFVKYAYCCDNYFKIISNSTFFLNRRELYLILSKNKETKIKSIQLSHCHFLSNLNPVDQRQNLVASDNNDQNLNISVEQINQLSIVSNQIDLFQK